MPERIPPPAGSLPDVPDKDTAKGISDWAAATQAGGRVLHLNLIFCKYGVDDKTHAASIFLSVLLLLVLSILFVVGFWAANPSIVDKALTILSSAFTFTSGVAIGRGAVGSKSE